MKNIKLKLITNMNSGLMFRVYWNQAAGAYLFLSSIETVSDHCLSSGVAYVTKICSRSHFFVNHSLYISKCLSTQVEL